MKKQLTGMKTKIITRSVWILSLVSLFTDISSEMLYPVMPVYLKSIEFSVVLIGILEGFAEATAGISKGYFGNLSDQMGKRLPFVSLGYLLSSISKPMLAAFIFPAWVFFARTIDRLGKGLRTGARDAMLSDQTIPENKAKIFGFHRGMDTLGAAIGPVVALVYLYYNPGSYKTLFLIAFIPGILGALLTFLLKDTGTKAEAKTNYSFFHFFKYWKLSSREYRQLVIGLLAFTFFNSSDVFLLLLLKQRGFDDTMIISAYIFYNLVYAVMSYPMGSLADRIGTRITFIIGLAIFVVVYIGMAFNHHVAGFYVLFFLYGVYAASTEGISKAWISNICRKEEVGTAIGFYSSFHSLLTMAASTFAGLIWYQIDPSATFIFTGCGVVCVIIYFLVWKPAAGINDLLIHGDN
jgi:MFS family permease